MSILKESHENLIVGVADKFHAATLVQDALSVDDGEIRLAAHNNWAINSLQGEDPLSETQLEGFRAIGCRVKSREVLGKKSFAVPAGRRFAVAAAKPDWKDVISGINTFLKLEESSLSWAVASNVSKFRGVSSGLLLGTSLVAFSNPESRPLVFGHFSVGGIAIASEVATLKTLGVDTIEEVTAGEIIEFGHENGRPMTTSIDIIT